MEPVAHKHACNAFSVDEDYHSFVNLSYHTVNEVAHDHHHTDDAALAGPLPLLLLRVDAVGPDLLHPGPSAAAVPGHPHPSDGVTLLAGRSHLHPRGSQGQAQGHHQESKWMNLEGSRG